MRRVALKIPLRAFSAVRGGQRSDPADARIESLRDALNHPALARGIPSLEEHNQLVARGNNPFLQLDELTLHSKKLSKIFTPLRLRDVLFRLRFRNLPFREHPILNFHLQLLVEAVDQVIVDAFEDFLILRF